MFYKNLIILVLGLFVGNLTAQQVTNDSRSTSNSRVTLEDVRYHQCANACVEIWRKWDNVINKELCQQQCLMSVMEQILKQSHDKEELHQDSKKEQE